MGKRFSVRAGRLRHKVDIQAHGGGQDDFGEKKPTWDTVETVDGSLEPRRGSERLDGEQILSEATHLVRMRFTPVLTTQHRLKIKGRLYDIEEVSNVEERDKLLELAVKEHRKTDG